jgi:hypothetical protein
MQRPDHIPLERWIPAEVAKALGIKVWYGGVSKDGDLIMPAEVHLPADLDWDQDKENEAWTE